MITSLLITNRGEIALPSILPELCSGRGTARHRRGVEGRARRRLAKNVPHHGVEIAKDIARGDAQRFDAVCGEQGVPPGISRGPILEAMRLAIDFDAQPRLGAVEIEDIRTRRMLATKFQPVRAGAKLCPQGNFGKREGAAQCSRSSNCLARFAQHSVCPSTMLCMVPLPKQSLGRILVNRTHP